MRQYENNIIINNRNIAIKHIKPIDNAPTILWLGGYLSDMFGTKVSFLQNWALKTNYGCVCFDFSYTGLSQTNDSEKLFINNPPGVPVTKDFLKASLSEWLEEAYYMYKNYCSDNAIIIGSSCGGWLALLLAQMLQKEATPPKSLILLAPAPDFTKGFNQEDLQKIEKENYTYIKEEDISLPFTKKFVDDAKQHYILNKILDIETATYILQGSLDKTVPKEHSLKIMNILPYSDASFSLITGANHGLSRAQDLEKLIQIIKL